MSYNKTLTHEDLTLFKETIKNNNWETRFPHVDLWGKDDAILKWVSVINQFTDSNLSNLKVVDLGCASGCTPHILSDLGNDVIAIDKFNINHFCKNSKVKMILNDAFEELKSMKNNSIDVFIDLCAVTHFDTGHNNEVENIGWKQVAEQTYRILKQNGKFLLASDCNILNDRGEFIKPSNIIKIFENCGFKLDGNYDLNFEKNCYSFHYNGANLQVVSLSFIKP